MREVPEKVQVWDICIHICTYHTHTTTIHRPHIFSHIHHTCITLSTHITLHIYTYHTHLSHTYIPCILSIQYTQTQQIYHTFHMHRPHLHTYQILYTYLTHISLSTLTHILHNPHTYIYCTLSMHIHITQYTTHIPPQIYDTPLTSIHIQTCCISKPAPCTSWALLRGLLCLHQPPASL